MTPVYFGDCFGWLHPAQGGRGIVICGAHGVEELCTHRFMRHLADQIAAAGMPALRFDYQGTGDSMGNDTDPDRVQHWLASIDGAIEYLKLATGVSEVALVGFRLGSLLATQLAKQRGDITSLALLGPVTSGKAYLREMKILGQVVSETTRSITLDEQSRKSNDLVVAGFTITAETNAYLQSVNLLALSEKPADHVMIYGRPNIIADERLAGHLHKLGCTVKQGVMPGLADLQWDTSFAELPDDAFASVVQWLMHDLTVVVTPVTKYVAGTNLNNGVWNEQPIQFGPEQRLFGVHCLPVEKHSTHQSKLILFINHGANPHTGWARMYVTLARRFAGVGVASMRIDISGVGDSPAHSQHAENQLYARHSQYDVYAALDWAQQAGFKSITLIGHCAGAYLSFYSALRDKRVSNLVMLNLQRFFWSRGQTLASVTKQSFRSSRWYLNVAGDRDVWRRLITGKVNALGIGAALIRRTARRVLVFFASTFGPMFGAEGLSGKVVQWLRELSARGTRVLLVYSAEDAGLDEIATHAGTNAKKARKLDNVQLEVIDGADHNLTLAWAQNKYAEILERFIVDSKS